MNEEHEYEVIVIDDGTLDTVVSVEGTEYRYNWYPDPDNVSPRRALNWVRYTLKEAIKGSADEEMLKQALEIVEDLREKEVSA